MKKIISIIALLIFILSLSSCTKSNSSTSIDTNISGIITKGSWIITLYNDNGTDKIYLFSGYTFTFSSGIVTANKNGTNVTGYYTTKYDDSKNKLILDFNTTIPFDELNDDWHILEVTTSKIRLQDVSGGNGGIDYLTFEKK